MFSVNEPYYIARRPPVMPVTRIEEFTCYVCKQVRFGPPNSKVCPGKCRQEHTRMIGRRTAARVKRRRLEAATKQI